MREEKVLILDKDVDAGEILKEHINSFGYFKVYLSTNPLILDDLEHNPAFQFIFIDLETFNLHQKHKNIEINLSAESPVVAVMNREYDDQVKALMNLFNTRIFLRKPFQIKPLSEILSRAN